jgi:hypothetical protein
MGLRPHQFFKPFYYALEVRFSATISSHFAFKCTISHPREIRAMDNLWVADRLQTASQKAEEHLHDQSKTRFGPVHVQSTSTNEKSLIDLCTSGVSSCVQDTRAQESV